MRLLEAKDFLVQQTAEQAALENVPLSDLEKRMMYFTETDECPEDPIALNEAFEAEYSTEEYEAKISSLLRHAYKRVRKDDIQKSRTWDSAIKRLRRGDNYLLVMWDIQPTGERPPYDSVKLFGAAMLLVFVIFVFNFAWDRIAPHLPHSLGWITRRLIMYSLVGVFFIGRYYWRRNRR
ncbi:MAG TPA: hypothetical protein VI431_05820 [Candidatus Acidoferrum sp.]